MHRGKVPGKQEEVIVHHALGAFSYDERAKLYRFRAWLASGMYTDAEARVTGEKSLEWQMNDPRRGTTRFTIAVNDAGQWVELGEHSQDGKTWQKFFEMTMRRMP
jgi:hypothetical protein